MPTPRTTLLLIVLLCAPLLALPPRRAEAATTPIDRTVQVSAAVQASPAQITLSWSADPNATGYTLFRKSPAASAWGAGTPLAASATSYSDTSVTVGTPYEYQIVKATGAGYSGYGYVYAGIELPPSESRGTLLLIVDQTYAASLAAELTRLQRDLVGDGWLVQRHDVARDASVPSVKALISADYSAAPTQVKAVLLFGHVPVPYSGDLNPDGHAQHLGAWPADVYYGDMDGKWTDTTVNDVTATRAINQNIPGDGKFDQTFLPSDVELQVGRVDLADMPTFAPKTELDLLRQYLEKDHNFRHKMITAATRALVDDNFGDFSGEAFASSGWRSFAPLVGPANISAADWFTTLNTQSYLWGYGCGGGSYTSASGVGSTTSFKNTDTKVVFTMLFGSYFGDWDAQNSFLRAPLATATYGLTSVWSGRPFWFMHRMGLGEPIGDSARRAQNNSGTYSPSSYGSRFVHIALMGDPTLRMQVVAPPAALTSTVSLSNSVRLGWTAAPDAAQGYAVYRAASDAGPFARISTGVLTATNFTDTSIVSGTSTYMVRAVKLETTPSGSFTNLSQGIFGSVTVRPPTAAIMSPSGGAAFSAPAAISVSVEAADSDGTVSSVALYAGALKIGETTSAPYRFAWGNVPPGSYALTAVATDNSGLTATSPPIVVTVSSAAPTPTPIAPTPTLTPPIAPTPTPARSTLYLPLTQR